MERWLYTSDLHGWTWGYEQTLEQARRHGAQGIIVGGDLLPNGPNPLALQRGFIQGFLADFLVRVGQAGLTWHGILGNDDLGIVLADFRALLATLPHAHDPSAGWQALGATLRIRGLSEVPDHPFGLKDWSVLDTPGWEPPPCRGRTVRSTPDGLVPIEDYQAWLAARPTLAERLEACLDQAPPMDQAVMLVHCPPAGLGLGKISQREDVGSRALRDWLAARQPLLSLHGHIHESPMISGLPMARLGRGICVQCGQEPRHRLHYALLDYEAGGLEVHIASAAGP